MKESSEWEGREGESIECVNEERGGSVSLSRETTKNETMDIPSPSLNGQQEKRRKEREAQVDMEKRNISINIMTHLHDILIIYYFNKEKSGNREREKVEKKAHKRLER